MLRHHSHGPDRVRRPRHLHLATVAGQAGPTGRETAHRGWAESRGHGVGGVRQPEDEPLTDRAGHGQRERSRSIEPAGHHDAHRRALDEDPVERVRQLRAEPGGNIEPPTGQPVDDEQDRRAGATRARASAPAEVAEQAGLALVLAGSDHAPGVR